MQKLVNIVTKLFPAIVAIGLGLSFQSAQAWVVYNQTNGSQPICASRGDSAFSQTNSTNPTYTCRGCNATKIYIWNPINNTDQECGFVWTFTGGASCQTATEVQPHGYVVVTGTASNCEAAVYPPDPSKPNL